MVERPGRRVGAATGLASAVVAALVALPLVASPGALTGCAHDSPQPSQPSAERTPPRGIAATPPTIPSAGEAVQPPTPPTASYGGAMIETACNGVDDDGDGLVDVLLPVGPNACTTPLPGACGAGFAACEKGARVCMAPAPMPEVYDGIDNDCNGKVDDVPAIHVRPRALVLAPRYAWGDAGPDIADVIAALAQAGIPYDAQSPGTDWSTALDSLGHYSLAVVPGYLIGGAMGARARGALEEFARNGGVVAVFKPVGSADEPQAWKLTGITASVRRRDVTEIHFDGERGPAVTDLDSPEERTLNVNERGAPVADGVEVYFLEPDAAEGTQVLAHAVAGTDAKAVVEPVFTRRPLGKGAIYALGHDLSTFAAPRCYVNCFEPSGDVLRLVLEGMLRESAAGHVILTHTVPGAASSLLLVTHDIDAPDADNEGPWGPPGALQAAEMEAAHGVRATFNITTDYVAGYYNEKTVRSLCDRGLCPLGAHSVTHLARFGELPLGTCAETRATYSAAPPTLCAEIRVSRDMIAKVMGRPPTVWRSPYLALPPHLFRELASAGFAYDSSFGVGDLPFNLPVDLAVVGFHQNRFERAPLVEFPIALEDGQGDIVAGATTRIELQATNRGRFSTLWDYTLMRNAQNRGITTILLHPSCGREMPPENLKTKLSVLDAFLGRAASLDVEELPLEEVGAFWRARLDTRIDASYDPASGYTGTIAVGKEPVRGLTLEFGDVVREFTCAACGKATVHGKRVVLGDELPRDARASFVAIVH